MYVTIIVFHINLLDLIYVMLYYQVYQTNIYLILEFFLVFNFYMVLSNQYRISYFIDYLSFPVSCSIYCLDSPYYIWVCLSLL